MDGQNPSQANSNKSNNARSLEDQLKIDYIRCLIDKSESYSKNLQVQCIQLIDRGILTARAAAQAEMMMLIMKISQFQ